MDGLQRWKLLLTLWVVGVIELYFADETGLTLQPYVPYGWQKKGHPLQLPCRTANKGINLLGFLRLDNGLTIYHSESTLTGDFVAQSLADFANMPHSKPVVIVLDNGPIHRCQAIYQRQAEWEEKQMYLFFLPAYSPHLNPIEIRWRLVKYRWLRKADYSSWNRLKKAIFTIIADCGKHYRICFEKLTRENIVSFNSA